MGHARLSCARLSALEGKKLIVAKVDSSQCKMEENGHLVPSWSEIVILCWDDFGRYASSCHPRPFPHIIAGMQNYG